MAMWVQKRGFGHTELLWSWWRWCWDADLSGGLWQGGSVDSRPAGRQSSVSPQRRLWGAVAGSRCGWWAFTAGELHVFPVESYQDQVSSWGQPSVYCSSLHPSVIKQLVITLEDFKKLWFVLPRLFLMTMFGVNGPCQVHDVESFSERPGHWVIHLWCQSMHRVWKSVWFRASFCCLSCVPGEGLAVLALPISLLCQSVLILFCSW